MGGVDFRGNAPVQLTAQGLRPWAGHGSGFQPGVSNPRKSCSAKKHWAGTELAIQFGYACTSDNASLFPPPGGPSAPGTARRITGMPNAASSRNRSPGAKLPGATRRDRYRRARRRNSVLRRSQNPPPINQKHTGRSGGDRETPTHLRRRQGISAKHRHAAGYLPFRHRRSCPAPARSDSTRLSSVRLRLRTLALLSAKGATDCDVRKIRYVDQNNHLLAVRSRRANAARECS